MLFTNTNRHKILNCSYIKHCMACFFLCLLFSSNVLAKITSESLTLSINNSIDENKIQPINSHTINTLIHSQNFTILESNHTTADALPWLKIEWDKNKLTDEKFIINDFPMQASEDYFLIKNNQVIQHYHTGNSKPFNNRPIQHFKFVADLKNADYVLVKVCCNPAVPRYFRLLNEKELNQDYYHSLIKYAIAYSLIALMILYNFCIYLFLRDKQYILYCIYLSAVFFGLLAVSGIGKQFVWPTIVGLEALYFNSGLVISLTSILFVTNFLDKQWIGKKSLLIVRTLIALHCLIIVTVLITYYVSKDSYDQLVASYNLISQVLALITMLVNDFLIIRNMIKGDKSAKFILISYTIINIGIALFLLRYNGLIPDTPWNEFFIDIAAVLEALILSFALAQKIQTLRLQKIDAEKKQLLIQKQYSHQLLQVQEEEKKQLGSALHDNFTHELLVLKTNMEETLGKEAKETKQVDKILHNIRDISHLVHPYLLEKLGVKDALQELICHISDMHALDINFACADLQLNKQDSLMVFRIVQESLNNIVKHADAEECVIAIAAANSNKDIQIIIKDDGKGFDTQKPVGFGLKTIKERCHILNGQLLIESGNNGTQLTIIFPYRPFKNDALSQLLTV